MPERPRRRKLRGSSSEEATTWCFWSSATISCCCSQNSEMTKYLQQNDPQGLCHLLQEHDSRAHAWISYIVYMYHEFSSLCKKNIAFCEKLAECLRSSSRSTGPLR